MAEIRYIKQSDILRCPFAIMVMEHFREDGSCKCDDPREQAKMVREWGYTKREISAALQQQGRTTRRGGI